MINWVYPELRAEREMLQKCRSMSQELISSHVTKQSKIKAGWRNKMESNPEFSERKAKEVSQREKGDGG